MSPDVLNFLAVLVSKQSVSLSDPNFDQVVSLASKTRRELLEELEKVKEEE